MPSRGRVNKIQATLKLLRLGLVLGVILVLLLGIAMAVVGPTIGVGLYQSVLSGIVAAGWHVGPGVPLSQWIASMIAPIIAICIVVRTPVLQLPDELLALLIVPVCAHLTRWLQAWQVAVLTLSVMVAAMLRDLRTRAVYMSPLWLQQVTYCVSAPRAPAAIC